MLATRKGNILISCCGALHVPKMPSFPGIDKFKGSSSNGKLNHVSSVMVRTFYDSIQQKLFRCTVI